MNQIINILEVSIANGIDHIKLLGMRVLGKSVSDLFSRCFGGQCVTIVPAKSDSDVIFCLKLIS